MDNYTIEGALAFLNDLADRGELEYKLATQVWVKSKGIRTEYRRKPTCRRREELL